MSPSRTSKDGTFRLDWRRREIGRIAVSSGQRTTKGWRQAMALLDALYARNELEILRALKAGAVSMKEIMAAEKSRALHKGDALRTLVLRRPLWPAVEAWVGEPADANHDRYRVSLAKLRKVGGLSDNATVADLERVDWGALRAGGEFKSAADWNALRRAVSRLLTVMLDDKHHPARYAVLKRIPRAQAKARKVSLSVGELWQLVNALPETVRPGIMLLACTGMRLGEYERARPEHLTVLPNGGVRIDVQGTKTAGSAAVIDVAPSLAMWIHAAVPMPFKRLWFRRRFKQGAKAIGRPELRLHDLRHAAAMFALEAGAPIHAVRDLLRHEDATMTLDYARGASMQLAAKAVGKALKRASR